MKTFTAEQINTAYKDVDQRVLRGIEKTNVDKILIDLREQHSFSLEKLDMLRTAIDFVLIGLMSARELTAQVKNSFPDHHQKIINLLNKEVFQPVLTYVRSHQPITPAPASEVPAPKDALAAGGIEVLEEEKIEDIPPPQTPPASADNVFSTEHVTLIEEVPVKPKTEASTSTIQQPTTGQDPYREPIA